MLNKFLEGKISPPLVGFYQALGVVIYTIIVASFLNYVAEISKINPPDIVVAPFMMSLLVLSAGITGSLVFGLPAYYAFSKNNVARALATLGYTFAFLFTAILFAGVAIFLIF